MSARLVAGLTLSLCPTAQVPDISAGAVLVLIPGVTLASAPSTNWTSVASSADGTKLVAAAGGIYVGQTYTSTNSGFTWARTSAPIAQWTSVASSADGSKLVAAAGDGNTGPPGPIYTSTDFGFTWNLSSAPNMFWSSVASSADGSKLVAAVDGYYGGGIYTSTNSGFTWRIQQRAYPPVGFRRIFCGWNQTGGRLLLRWHLHLDQFGIDLVPERRAQCVLVSRRLFC